MKAIDFREKIQELLDNESLCIDQKKLNKICKLHQSEKTCRYIILTAEGYFCCKNTKIAEAINEIVDNGAMKATGDNCNGLKTQ